MIHDLIFLSHFLPSLYLAPMECKYHEGKHLGLVYPLACSKGPQKCLEHSRCSIAIFNIAFWSLTEVPRAHCLASRSSPARRSWPVPRDGQGGSPAAKQRWALQRKLREGLGQRPWKRAHRCTTVPSFPLHSIVILLSSPWRCNQV